MGVAGHNHMIFYRKFCQISMIEATTNKEKISEKEIQVFWF